MGTSAKSSKLQVLLPVGRDYDRILTPTALEFVTDLHTHFDDRRLELLAVRAERQKSFDGGAKLGFLSHTNNIRGNEW